VFGPGFFSSSPVHVALIVGGLSAVVCGVVGTFTVLRGQSYAGHALADLSVTGGSASFLANVSALWGFAGMGVLAAGIMDMIGIRNTRGRDLATGIVRGAGLGLGALFLFWDANKTSTTGASITILFGSMFSTSTSEIPIVVGFGIPALAIVAILYRPLLLSTVSPELGAVRGVKVRLTGLACLLAIALAVSLSAITVGAILSTALLVGPAAIALRLTNTPGRATLTAAAIGLGATWIGIVLAYDSYNWPPSGHGGWPVSFFIVALIFVAYLAAQLLGRRRAGAVRAEG
jgi:zinc/manganese transport system permease protein